MRTSSKLKLTSLVIAVFQLIYTHPVFAATAGVSNVENFIRNIIQIVAGLAGLVATGFFVIGGFGYITSSGNPENLEKSKRTLVYSAIGLAITIGAFVLSNIISDVAAKAFGG